MGVGLEAHGLSMRTAIRDFHKSAAHKNQTVNSLKQEQGDRVLRNEPIFGGKSGGATRRELFQALRERGRNFCMQANVTVEHFGMDYAPAGINHRQFPAA